MCSTTIYASTCIVLALTSGECLGEASSLATYPSNAYHSVCVHNMSYIHKHTIMVDYILQESWFPLGIRLLDVVALLPSTFLARVVECTSTLLAPLSSISTTVSRRNVVSYALHLAAFNWIYWLSITSYLDGIWE